MISLSRQCQSEAETAGTPLVSTAGPMACLVGGSPFLLICASAEGEDRRRGVCFIPLSSVQM